VELALLKMCNLLSVFNMASVSNGSMSSEGQLKKKPDSAGLAAEKASNSAPEVAIVSDTAVAYEATKTPAANQPPVKETKPEAPAERPRVFIPNLNASSTSVKIPSLKDVSKTKEEVQEEEDPYLKGDAKDDYLPEQFAVCWSDYAAKLKTEGKKNLLTIFISNPPKMIAPNSYEVIVENKVQENLFRDERPYLLNFLRSNLKNFGIEVSVRIDEKEVVKRPYTASEKFQHMAAKNPTLVDLKTKFNLDFD
jgi:DNA polymerase III subunit gamma/tau